MLIILLGANFKGELSCGPITITERCQKKEVSNVEDLPQPYPPVPLSYPSSSLQLWWFVNWENEV